MFIKQAENEHGTPITLHRCDECGGEFTVTPAVPEDKRAEWNVCMAETCPSYEPTRDADLYFSLGMAEREPTPRQRAWTEVNDLLDAGGGETAAYREAWEKWVRLAMPDADGRVE